MFDKLKSNYYKMIHDGSWKKYLFFVIIALIVIITIIAIVGALSTEEISYVEDYRYKAINESETISYTGNILEGKPNGDGKLIIKENNDTIIFEGIFENGQFLSGNVFKTKNNNAVFIQNATFENNNIKSGKVEFTDKQITLTKEGQFENDKLKGIGTIKLINEDDIIINETKNFD